MDKVLYGTCCNYAYSCLKKLNITEYRSEDIVNEFFFDNEISFNNYKKHIFETIKKLKIKPLIRLNTEYQPSHQYKAKYIDETSSQCLRCGKTKPIDYFYIYRFNPTKKCKECISIESRREYAINTGHRLLSKKNKDIKAIDELIFLLNQKKQEIINQKLN